MDPKTGTGKTSKLVEVGLGVLSSISGVVVNTPEVSFPLILIGIGFFVHTALSGGERTYKIQNLVWNFQNLQWRVFLKYPNRVLVAMVVVPLTVLWFIAHSSVESYLYGTGRFGEPEENRYVNAAHWYDKDGQRYNLLMECGVNFTDVNGVDLGIALSHYNVIDIRSWVDRPKMTYDSTDLSSHHENFLYASPTILMGSPWARFKVQNIKISRSESMYVWISCKIGDVCHPLLPEDICWDTEDGLPLFASDGGLGANLFNGRVHVSWDH